MTDLESEDIDDDDDGDYEPEELDLTADERRLVTQPYDYAVRQLVADVESAKILLIEVPYQRQYVWDDAKASRLIESLLLNVPIPVCYFAENEDGTWDVIDGLQRTHSITRFLAGEFPLRGLSVLSELNGKKFNELAGRDQRRIETRTIRCVVIQEESHPDIKFDVFERLNTGAVKLTAQELRNCVYRGTFNEQLKTLAQYDSFRKALGRPWNARMQDEELVLRFLALYEDLPAYKPPLSQCLNEYMRDKRLKKPSASSVKVFKSVLETVNLIFGATAFRMMRDGEFTNNVNRALYDAVVLSFAFADRSSASKKAKAVTAAHRELITSDGFAPLVGRATADRTRMHGRVHMYTDMLLGLGIRSSLPDLPEE